MLILNNITFLTLLIFSFTFQIFTRSPWLMPTGKLVEPRITQFLICFFAKIPSTANSPFLPGCQNASISSKTLGIKIWKSNLFWIMHPTTYFVGCIIQKRSTYCISSSNFRYSESDLEYLRQALPSNVEEDFFQYLRDLTAKDIKIYALHEGSIAFPR